jgi:hypothetical protein
MSGRRAQPRELNPEGLEHIDIFYGADEPWLRPRQTQAGRRQQSSMLERALAGSATNHGVAWHEGRGQWMARALGAGGAVTHLGFFADRQDALDAFAAACASKERPIPCLVTRRGMS